MDTLHFISTELIITFPHIHCRRWSIVITLEKRKCVYSCQAFDILQRFATHHIKNIFLSIFEAGEQKEMIIPLW